MVQIRVQIKGTEKGTNKGYKSDQNSYIYIPENIDSIYNRPYDSLAGIPKKIVDVIFEFCRKCGTKETPPLPIAALVRFCNEKKNSVKVARKRLLSEKIITTKKPLDSPAKGRSGMLVYKLREDLFEEINNSLSLLARSNEPLIKKGTNQGTRAPSSSINKTTTTALPEEWKKIDCTPLKDINFGSIELKNIFRKCSQHINHLIVQDSINQFAFGLLNNPDRYKNMHAPSGILVKSLCEGNPWIENGYISQDEKLRIEKENRIKKLLEQQFKEPKFLDWFNALDEEVRETLVPHGVMSSTSYMISKTIIQRDHAYKHFEHEIWPAILLKLSAEMG